MTRQYFSFLNNRIFSMSIFSSVVLLFILFGTYLAVRTNPNALEKPFAIMTITTAAGIVVTAFTTGLKNGGWVNPENYDVVVPVLLLGALLSPSRWRGGIWGVAFVGLFFSGAEIGLVAVAVLAGIVLIRQDLSWRAAIPIGAVLLCLTIATPLGITQKLWLHNDMQVTLGDRIQAAFSGGDVRQLDYAITGNRFYGNWNIWPATLFGHGLVLNQITETTPHNQLLIIIDQIGIIAAIAWILASLHRMIKTGHYYIWGVVFAVGIVDHFFWTFAAPWWWALMALRKNGSGNNDN